MMDAVRSPKIDRRDLPVYFMRVEIKILRGADDFEDCVRKIWLPLAMETPLYHLARMLVALVQALPLTWVARLGRLGGGLAYWFDARHRRVALRNLILCFGGEQSPAQLRAVARENFRRIGENFACAIKTAAMNFEELRPRVEFVGNPQILSPPPNQKPQKVVVAIGHFGNFELYARFGQFVPAYQCATTRRDSGVYAVVLNNPVGRTSSSNATLLVRVPQKLDTPTLLADGTLALLSGDADGGLLLPSDLPGFQAKASSNLVDWVTLSESLTLTNGMLLLRDAHTAHWPLRFYRIIEP